MKIRIHRLNADVRLPAYQTSGSAAFDLAASALVTIAPGTVEAGDRIAQGIVLPAPQVEWEEVAEVRAASRGGFGATGGGQVL